MENSKEEVQKNAVSVVGVSEVRLKGQVLSETGCSTSSQFVGMMWLLGSWISIRGSKVAGIRIRVESLHVRRIG